MKNQNTLGTALLLLVAMIWGTAFVFQRMGMESIGPVTFTAARMSLAAAAVGFVSRLRGGKSEKAGRREALSGGLCCGLFLCAASLFQQAGMVSTSAGKAGFITALYILLVPVLNLVLFKRRCGARVWLAAALGAAGLYLLCVTEELRLTGGDTLVCVCAFLFTGHILCCDHFARRADPVRIAAVQFAVVALLSWVVAFAVEEPSLDQLRKAAVPILYCGLVSCGVGYTLQLVAQGMTEPTVASLLMSLEAVFAVLAGALLLHERMSRRELLGCAVMFAAILLVQLPARSGARPGVKD